MREPHNLLSHLASALTDARLILATMTPAQRSEAEREAAAKGVSVVMFVAREIGVLVREAEIQDTERPLSKDQKA